MHTRTAFLLFCLLALAGCRGPGPFRLESSDAQSDQVPFLAGVATTVFTPARGYPLGGYGGGARREEFPWAMGIGWHGRIALAAHMAWNESGGSRSDMLVGSEGVHDDLTARAIVLRPEGRSPVALVRIDAIGMTLEVFDQVIASVEDLGYSKDSVVITATHTHSGMGGFIRSPFGCVVAMDNFRPELESRLVDACAVAIREAHESARPAEIGFGRARDRDADGEPVIAVNRRSRQFDGEIAPDEIDDEIGLILLRDAKTAERIALLVNYAVHPTVLGPDNLHYSADLTGGVERALTARLDGTPVLFVNGAEGDIGPGRIEAKGGLKRVRELGEAFSDLVEGAVGKLETSPTLSIGTATGTKEMGAAFMQLAMGRERFIDGDEGVMAWIMAPITLPINVIFWTLGFTELRLALSWNMGFGLVVHFGDLIGRTRTRINAFRIRAGDEDVALATFPGEATHDVGQALRANAKRLGATRSFVLGLGQDHIMYICSRKEYRRGGYEAASTLFGQDTATQLLDGQVELLKSLGYVEPGS